MQCSRGIGVALSNLTLRRVPSTKKQIPPPIRQQPRNKYPALIMKRQRYTSKWMWRKRSGLQLSTQQVKMTLEDENMRAVQRERKGLIANERA
jgi:hypothetical protein